MGYYSDVALAFTGVTLNAFRKKLAGLAGKTREETDNLFRYAAKHHTDANSECWFWQEIKWYAECPEDFPDIDFVEKFLAGADEEEFYFVRCGEDYDDNEVRGLWWDNPFGITLCRGIVLDC